MSSNDLILISRKDFKVYHADAEGGYNHKIAQGKNLDDAIDKAQEWQQARGYCVEYGIDFI